MPIMTITTNVSKTKISSDFMEKLVAVLAATIGKPPERCVCGISTDAILNFGGQSDGLGAVASLESVGKLGPKENMLISQNLSKFLEKEIGIPPKRFYITFHDMRASDIGVDGTTVEAINAASV